MESNWCFPNIRKALNEEQKSDKNNKTKEKRLREKENETASSRLNEKQKNDENDKVESNWYFPKKWKTLINEEQKTKEKRLSEKEDETQSSRLTEEKLQSVKRKFSINGISGGVPEPRALYSMIHIGRNIIALYGGINANN